jgi:sirohydrochlorin cobaltochelatase
MGFGILYPTDPPLPQPKSIPVKYPQPNTHRKCLAMPTFVILLAHGSHDARWREPFEQLLATLQANPATQAVALAYMEMAEPILAQAAQQAIGLGATHVQILPLFMASGGHLRHDVPHQVATLQQQHPHITWTLLPPVGEHPKIQGALQTIVGECFEPWGK